MSKPRVIFNSSLPRSGSTLLQNIFAQNPRFYASPTSGVVNMLVAARASFTESSKAQDRNVMRAGFQGFCRRGLEGFYEDITDKPVCVDKSRDWIHYYDWVNSFYPQQKVLICIRDPRAIVASMEKLFRKNRDLMDRADAMETSNLVTLANRVRYYLSNYPLGVQLMRMLEAIETGRIKQFQVIRFEDLCSNPGATMRKVYEYLGEAWFEHDFNNVVQQTQENDAYSLPFGEHTILAKVEPVQPDYNDLLGKELANQVKADLRVFYDTFYPRGY